MAVRRILIAYLLAAAAVGQAQIAPPLQPKLPPARMGVRQVCGLMIDAQRLVVKTALPPDTASGSAIELAEMPGSTVVSVSEASFSMVHSHNVSDGSFITLMVDQKKDQLLIEHTIGPGMKQKVRLIQAYTDRQSDIPAGHVVLRVLAPDFSRILDLIEPDFVTLCRKHRREVDRYLTPAFRSLGCGYLLSVDPVIARQVLSPRLRVDQVDKRLSPLIRQLDSDSFRERDLALRRITELGASALENLGKLDRSQLSPQQFTCIESLHRSANLLTLEEIETLRRDPHFVIDCLYSDQEEIRRAALAMLGSMLKVELKIDPKAAPATQADVIENVRSSLLSNGRAAGQQAALSEAPHIQ